VLQETSGDAGQGGVDFVAYAEDCRVEGKIDLADTRLADLLNSHETITVYDCVVTSTEDGHARTFEELEIGRDELDIVVASGPRGDPSRRLATRPAGVAMQLGPYSAAGFMHGPPSANPVRGFHNRPIMVALTDAILEYQFCREPVEERFGTVLVNRHLAQSLHLLEGSLAEEIARGSEAEETAASDPEAAPTAS
jgi:hypothetical protein